MHLAIEEVDIDCERRPAIHGGSDAARAAGILQGTRVGGRGGPDVRAGAAGSDLGIGRRAGAGVEHGRSQLLRHGTVKRSAGHRNRQFPSLKKDSSVRFEICVLH